MPSHRTIRGSAGALVDAFAETVEPARALVVSDFDGTLAKIVPDPGAARPLPGLVAVLARLTELVRAVAVLSGRSEADLHRLLPVPGLRRLGDYGHPPPGPAEQAALRAFNAEAETVIAGVGGLRIEAKPGSTSVHFRGNPEAGDRLLLDLAGVARRHGLQARSGRLVVEVLPRGWDKSLALRALVAELDPAGVVFAGDDAGDEGCFTYLSTLDRPHLLIGVASDEVPPGLFEHCDLVVDGPDANAALLSRLAAEWGRRARGRAGRAPAG